MSSGPNLPPGYVPPLPAPPAITYDQGRLMTVDQMVALCSWCAGFGKFGACPQCGRVHHLQPAGAYVEPWARPRTVRARRDEE